jgi:YesN/AraC family two-component response regulator
MKENYKVMVVDDEQIMLDAIATQMPWEKYQISIVKTAAHAIEAMEYLQNYEVNLILVDIRMPVINGIGFIQIAREQNRALEFIAISGYADFSYVQQVLRLGARDYLLKPFDEATLLKAVQDAKAEWEQRRFFSDLQNIVINKPDTASGTHAAYSGPVSQVLRIIDDEIGNKDLTLKWICAQRLFLNENYLCKKFQEEVKQRFSAYLFEHRMILAMRLIAKTPNVHIQAVARETGFGDNAQYFSISFKKYTGYTPTEYRRHIHSGTWRKLENEFDH